MGKYLIEGSKGQDPLTQQAEVQLYIANELAEANRLKRLELVVSKLNGKTVITSDEELEDQA